MTRNHAPSAGQVVPAAAFICKNCGGAVSGQAPRTEHRNHCPSCLRSLHVDMQIGDRRSGCRGVMEPIAISVRYDGEWMLVHRCKKCGFMRVNRIAGDDNEWALVALASRPIAMPPFPLEKLCKRSGMENET